MIIAALLASALLQDPVDNPEYKGWAAFKPGSSVTYKYNPQNGGQKVTLKSVSDTEIVLETEITYEGKSAPATERKVPAKIPAESAMKNIKEGEDTIEVAGKSLKCKTKEGEKKLPGGKMTTIKIWIHEDIPGSAAKVQTTTGGVAGFSMAATEWEKK